MIPRVLHDFSLVIEGRPAHGLVETLTLPKLSRKMDDYQAGGMGGPVSLDLGQEALSLEFTLAEFDRDVLKAYGAFGVGALNLRFLGAMVADDGRTDAIEVSGRGRWKVLEMGEAKRGDRSKMKVEMPLSVYRYRVNSETLIDIDLVQGIEVVGGVDRRAAIRAAIGLSYE